MGNKWMARKPIFPWLEENRALAGLALFMLGTLISVFSLITAIDANTRSRTTANRLTELTEGSLLELKKQAGALASQTDSLSKQLDEQRIFSARTARQLDNVIVTLSNEVSHLSDQTSSLSELVKQGKQQTLFAVKPYGWWRRNKLSTQDAAMRAVAHSTIHSSSFAWPAKESAIAFLTDAGFTLPGLPLRETAIDLAEFHNKDMRFSDFSQTSLLDVLFAPGDSESTIRLNHSNFNKSQLWSVKFRSAIIGGTDFRDAIISDSEFVRSDLSLSDVSHAQIINVTFDTVTAYNVNFANTMLQNAFFLCRDSDPLCSVQHGDQDSIIKSTEGLYSAIPGLKLTNPNWEKEATSTSFGNAIFSEAKIFNSKFAVYPGMVGNFSRAWIFGTSLDRQTLSFSSFYETKIWNSTFKGAVLKGINARKASFVNVSFDDAQIESSIFDGPKINATFNGASLKNVVIPQTDVSLLNGAKLSGVVNIVVNEASDLSKLKEQILYSGACTTEQFSGFGLLTGSYLKDVFEKEPEGILTAFVPEPRIVLAAKTGPFMARKCQ